MKSRCPRMKARLWAAESAASLIPTYFLYFVKYGRFERTLELPEGILPEKLVAEYHNGVLEITAPVTVAALPHKVEIKTVPLVKQKLVAEYHLVRFYRTANRVRGLGVVEKKKKAPSAALCRIHFGDARSCGGHTSRVADRNSEEAGLAHTPPLQTRTACIRRFDSDNRLEICGAPCEIPRAFLPRPSRAWPVRIPGAEIPQTHRSHPAQLQIPRAAAERN